MYNNGSSLLIYRMYIRQSHLKTKTFQQHKVPKYFKQGALFYVCHMLEATTAKH